MFFTSADFGGMRSLLRKQARYISSTVSSIKSSSKNLSLILTFSSVMFQIYSSGGDGFEGVKKWTRDVDVFAKQFLVVPVHEEAM